jgi:hypothetical protein
MSNGTVLAGRGARAGKLEVGAGMDAGYSPRGTSRTAPRAIESGGPRHIVTANVTPLRQHWSVERNEGVLSRGTTDQKEPDHA